MVKKLLGYTLLIALTSCTCQQQLKDDGKSFKVNLSPSEGLKDPLLNLDQERLKILSLVFEPLLAYSTGTTSGGDLVPVLLTELPTLSADQLTYNFKLKAAPFHTSSKLSSPRTVNSKDVVMSLLRGVTDDDISNYGNLLIGLIDGLSAWVKSTDAGEWYGRKLPAGIQIKNDTEFSIRLLRKYPDFLALLTLPAFSVQPHEMISGTKLSDAIGTGPYAFIDAAVETKNWNLKALANQKYPGVSVLESVDVADVKASDYSALSLKLAAEVIDPASGNLKDMPEHSLQELKVRRLEMLLLNLRDPVIKALGSDFRKALFSAIDADSVMAQMYRGFSLSSKQFIPPGVEGTLDEASLNMMSKEDAVKRLQKILAKKKIKVMYPETAPYWRQMEATLAEVGPFFEFEPVEVSTYLSKVEKSEYQIAPLSWEGDLPEATNFLQLYYSGSQNSSQNLSGYKSAAFDSAFDRLSKLFPSAERRKLAEEAHKIVLKDLPALPLGFKKDFVILGPRANGLNTKAFGSNSLKDFLLAP